MKYGIPNPPPRAEGHHAYVQSGLLACYIWIFDDEGAGLIDNQYATARQIMAAKQCSQATAYRLIAAEPKRYWVADLRDPAKPRCYSVLPRRKVQLCKVLPVGNPCWRSGIYQQSNRRRALDK